VSSSKERPPSFQFYPHDYLADRAVACMTLEQRGAYVNLLCHAWDSDDPGVLPDDDELLAGLSGLGPRWPDHRAAVMRAFAHNERGGNKVWVQKRMVIERTVQRVRYARSRAGADATNSKLDARQRQANARKAAQARWNKGNGDAREMRATCARMPAPSSSIESTSKPSSILLPVSQTLEAWRAQMRSDFERWRRAHPELETGGTP